jgi:hypothetical protein
MGQETPQNTVQIVPGGAETLLGHYGPMWALEGRKNVIIAVDGDQMPAHEQASVDTVSLAGLEDALKGVCRRPPFIPADAGVDGVNRSQLEANRRKVLRWMHDYVVYLPDARATPESFLARVKFGKSGLSASKAKALVTDRAHEHYQYPSDRNVDSGDITSFETMLVRSIPVDASVELKALRDRLVVALGSSRERA